MSARKQLLKETLNNLTQIQQIPANDNLFFLLYWVLHLISYQWSCAKSIPLGAKEDSESNMDEREVDRVADTPITRHDAFLF